jgi:hypothetical protein
MKITSLISKLNKMNVAHEIVNNNGYNADIQFVINGKSFYAGIVEDKDTVQDFCKEIGYDDVNQETQRRFYDNFNQLVKSI